MVFKRSDDLRKVLVWQWAEKPFEIFFKKCIKKVLLILIIRRPHKSFKSLWTVKWNKKENTKQTFVNRQRQEGKSLRVLEKILLVHFPDVFTHNPGHAL